MNGKQKRAYNAANNAILDLAKATIDDPVAFNASLQMLASAIGTMIGGACAAHSLDIKATHEATMLAGRLMQERAARIYAEYLAREKAATHGGMAQ
jgi:hypothetical protein